MKETEFKMPKMGESITEGTIINWLVNEGDSFEEGDILCEVATDKVDNEVPAPASGTMVEHVKDKQEVVPVGDVIAILNLSEEKSSSKKSKTAKKTATSKKETKKKVQPSVSKEAKSKKANATSAFTVNENVFISPLVESIARNNHISYEELARIPGTGKEGRLRKSDVITYIEEERPFKFAQPVPEVSGFQVPDLKFDKGTGKIVEMDRMRQMISDHMVFSATTAPHVTAYVEADLTDMVHWRNANKVAFKKSTMKS